MRGRKVNLQKRNEIIAYYRQHGAFATIDHFKIGKTALYAHLKAAHVKLRGPVQRVKIAEPEPVVEAPQPPQPPPSAVRISHPFDFSSALVVMKAGGLVRRVSWNGNIRHVGIFNARDGSGEVSSMFFYGFVAGNQIEPWLPNHGDLLANDYIVSTYTD